MASYVVAFESTHAALAAEAALKAVLPSAALIPIPRSISAGCGMALRFEAETPERAEELFETCADPGQAKLHPFDE